MNMERIIHCAECIHCLTDRRSRTGYSCEMWGYLDFASPTELTGWCYKAKPKNEPEKSYLRSGPMTEADMT